MDVNDLLKSKGNMVITVQTGETLRDVVRVMAEHNIGAVVVKDASGSLAGIISERDIVQGLQKFGLDLFDKRADEVITEPVITCGPLDTMFEIFWSMDANGIRHLPVIDGEKLVGMISVRDAMNFWPNVGEQEMQQLRELIAA